MHTLGILVLAAVVCANPQLDLPPLPTPPTQRNRPEVPSTFSAPLAKPAAADDDGSDDDDEMHTGGGARASDYDRDRSERFGPPYSLDNIERAAPPTSPPFRSGGDHQPRILNYPTYGAGYDSRDPRDPRDPREPPDPRDPRDPNYPSNGDNYRFFEGRSRPNGDDDRYYRPPGGWNDRDRQGGRPRPYGDDDKYYRPLSEQGPYNDHGDGYGRGGYGFPRDPSGYGGSRGGNYDNNGYPDYNRNQPHSDDDRNYQNRPQFVDDRYRHDQDRQSRLETVKLKQQLEKLDQQSSLECSLNVRAQWDFETNVNEITQINALKAQQRYSDFQRLVWDQMQHIDKSQILDPKLYRQVQLMSNIGASALPPDQLDRYNRIVNDMLAIYNKASICRFEQPFNCGLRLQPHLKDIMATNRDWEELQYTWTEFRRKSGRDMRDLYEQMVELTNQAAHYNHFKSAAAYWTYPYESPDFRHETDHAWEEILPLYELIHAYVRRKLREFYGPDRINRNAPLPEHVLGNMYGQTWSNILDITIPYPGRNFLDVTGAMLAQGYTPHIMFQLAEKFFESINMTVLPTDFWIDSITEQPHDGRTVLCQPSAWDFCNGHDVRVKMCTEVTHKSLITVHHEMTHVQYFVSYRKLPKVFREGANAAFHEALGDAIGLSVGSPTHLQSLGLIHHSVDKTEHDINYLFALALDKVVFLPFALSLDRWRWDIFDKHISKEQYNCHWWLLRERYSGIKPPVLRSEMDFDPGAKYHVPANIPYIRYFVSTILQFQIHRAMCRETRQYRPDDPHHPLHKCDIANQPAAGHILSRIMEHGTEQPWQDTLQQVIGEGRLDGSALREFFRPLEEWLRQENLRNNEFVGWIYDGDYCKHSIDTANLQVYGGFYNGARRTVGGPASGALALALVAGIISLGMANGCCRLVE